MIAFPPALAPPAPFPLVVAQAHAIEYVAPGIQRADYRLTTSDGPLLVHVVAIDLGEPTVRLDTVVARDHMISPGETVSSMAHRTGAVAGVNADYFDIGNTNQPLNVVVRNGTLQRTPSRRAALVVGRDRSVTFGKFSFSGTVSYGSALIPLTSVNEWPPQGGAALLTPAYGNLSNVAGVTIATLEAAEAAPSGSGTYRVTAIGPAIAGPVVAPELAFGPAAQAMASLPSVGDPIALTFDTQPPAVRLVAAVGGGPMLVANGLPADDADTPAPEETQVRFPVSGAATANDTLFLFAVDGRHAALSIGVTRPQFGALMRGFNAHDGMAFDSGGSSELVARVLGDADASVLNAPSDGVERPVADGLFAYSDAPVGVHPHLVVRPSTLAALPGADLQPLAFVVDDAGHRLNAASVKPVRAAKAPGSHAAVFRDPQTSMTTRVSYRTVARPTSLTIAPDAPNPDPGETLQLNVTATDKRGIPVVLGNAVRWYASRGRLSAQGTAASYQVAEKDATIAVAAGGVRAETIVRVGRHTVPLGGFTETPLAFDFTGGARAAYANLAMALPGEPRTFAVEVFGDDSGVALRAAFVNRFGERHALTLAPHVDWRGWRRLEVALPPDLNPPIRLTSLYAVPSVGGPPAHVAGAVRFRSPSVVLPGSS